MAVKITNVEFINNPARFIDVYKLRITFECATPLKDDIEWKLIFVSTLGKEDELDDCQVGPVPIGTNSFEFDVSPPNPSKISPEDVSKVAALTLKGSYNDQEFVRVEYYQKTDYDNEEMRKKPPAEIAFDRLVRDISPNPHVMYFTINWDDALP